MQGKGVIYGHFKQDIEKVEEWPIMYEFWSKYCLLLGNKSLPKTLF